MPTTDYKRDERLQVIHKCLNNGTGNWSIKRLLDKVNRYLAENGGRIVSARTIAADLKYLELNKYAPIVALKKGREMFYTYEEDFELNQPLIDKDEYFSLVLAHEVLQQLKGFPLLEDLQKIVRKLEHIVEDETTKSQPRILFEPAARLRNIEKLQDLFECTRAKTVLKLRYRPFYSTESVEKFIHPYFLKQYNQRWFLFGYNPKFDNIDNSPIDRIDDFKPVNVLFKENSRFLPSEYFNDMIGVTKAKGQEPETVQFRVAAARADYLETKPIHHSQKRIKQLTSGEVIYELHLIINKELISTILSFGKDMVVLSPRTLENVILEELKSAVKNY